MANDTSRMTCVRFCYGGDHLVIRQSLFRSSSSWWAHAWSQPPLPLALRADSRLAGDRCCCRRRCCCCRFRRRRLPLHVVSRCPGIQTDTRTGLNFCYRKQKQYQQSVVGGFGPADRRAFSSPVLLPVVSGPSVKVSVRFL